MKTLDEVIQALEWCISDTEDDCAGCPYDGEDGGCHQRNLDALHYLKAFRYAKDTLELEKDRYQEAVRNCEAAELKYRKLAQSLGEVGNAEIPLNPNVVFRPEGVYCGVCGSRLDQDREEG